MRPRSVLAGVAIAATSTVLLATVAASSDSGLWKPVLVAIALGLPGALGVTAQPRNAAGWLLLSIALAFACLGLAQRWVEAGAGSDWASWYVERGAAVVVPLTVLTLMCLPDGRLPSPRWRPVAAAVVVLQLGVIAVWSLVAGTPEAPNPIGVLPGDWAGPANLVGDALLQAPVVLGVAAVVVRLRRSDGARLSGLVWGVGCFAVLSIVGHRLWPVAADMLDILGVSLLGAGIASTLPRARVAESGDRPVAHLGPATTATGTPEPGPPGAETPELSTREQEVLELVAQGLTNREIAERLFISPVTARNHVSRILTKLGLENRTQAAVWLDRRRLRTLSVDEVV